MSTYRILQGDVMDRLADLPDGSVHCCVTSPPYWGLRDYGVDGQIGLEETPDAYVERLVEVFREVRRVLREDGTLWLVLGDSYAGSWGAQGRTGSMADRSVVSARQIEAHPKKASRTGSIPEGSGLKPKDLVGIPWRVAFALQADGWWLRSDIVWSKPNPMPESVQDRPTKAHEYVFLLSKSERYHYDADAIAEPATPDHPRTVDQTPDPSGGVFPEHRGLRKQGLARSGNAERRYGDDADRPGSHLGRSIPWEGYTRNKRTVWEIATRPYPEAHFAVFPAELAETCILAGSPRGGVVLDPFAGSGTTGMVATGHGRSAILIELNPDYVHMIRRRCGALLEEVAGD